MKRIVLPLLFLFGCATALEAQFLNTYQWRSRLVILFTPEPGDPLFERQVAELRGQEEAFNERDVIFLFIAPQGVQENTGIFLKESISQQYYQHFSPMREQFELVLVGLDGTEKFRARNTITPPSVLLEMIDGMPMRQQEIIQGYGNRSKVNSATTPKKRGGRKH